MVGFYSRGVTSPTSDGGCRFGRSLFEQVLNRVVEFVHPHLLGLPQVLPPGCSILLHHPGEVVDQVRAFRLPGEHVADFGRGRVGEVQARHGVVRWAEG